MTDIPQDDGLERVARALLAVEDSWNDHEWEQLPNSTKRLFKRNAAAALSAMPEIAALRAENEGRAMQ